MTAHVLDEDDSEELAPRIAEQKLDAKWDLGLIEMPKRHSHRSKTLTSAEATVDDFDATISCEFVTYTRPRRTSAVIR